MTEQRAGQEGSAGAERTDGGVPLAAGGGDDPPGNALGDVEEGEPIELLVQLAEDGEIDPWDIDIVRVTDKFLDRLDRADLRTSGRALFYASVLLRMKSDALLEPDQPDEPEPEPWEEPFGDAGGMVPEVEGDPLSGLEDELDRRLDRKRARGTPETLDELVRELREAERDSWWKDSREYDTSDSPRGFRRGTQTLDYHAAGDARQEGEPTEEEVTGTAHAEDIEETIADVRAVLETHFEAGRDEVLFLEVEDAGGSRVETFLAVLFLTHRGEIDLEQDELFGDLWIQSAGEDATDGDDVTEAPDGDDVTEAPDEHDAAEAPDEHDATAGEDDADDGERVDPDAPAED